MKTIVLYCPLCRGGTDHEVRQYSYGGREAACVICDRRVPLLDDDKPTVDDKPSHEDLEDRLAAAQERLAEMREALEMADNFIISRKPEKGGATVVARIRKLLSAAPARQMRWRKRVVFEVDCDSGDVAGWSEEDADYIVYFTDGTDLVLGVPFFLTISDATPAERGGE